MATTMTMMYLIDWMNESTNKRNGSKWFFKRKFYLRFTIPLLRFFCLNACSFNKCILIKINRIHFIEQKTHRRLRAAKCNNVKQFIITNNKLKVKSFFIIWNVKYHTIGIRYQWLMCDSNFDLFSRLSVTMLT